LQVLPFSPEICCSNFDEVPATDTAAPPLIDHPVPLVQSLSVAKSPLVTNSVSVTPDIFISPSLSTNVAKDPLVKSNSLLKNLVPSFLYASKLSSFIAQLPSLWSC